MFKIEQGSKVLENIQLTFLRLKRLRIDLVESGSFRPWVVSVWVVSALFWGESIRPILVGRFGRESFRPWVVSASLNIGAKSTYFCS